MITKTKKTIAKMILFFWGTITMTLIIFPYSEPFTLVKCVFALGLSACTIFWGLALIWAVTILSFQE